MKTLRLHQELYAEAAIDEATAVYAEHATVCHQRQDCHFIVTVEATRSELEDRVAGEFANYVLALSSGRGRATTRPRLERQQNNQGIR
jgi:hypothetical protein